MSISNFLSEIPLHENYNDYWKQKLDNLFPEKVEPRDNRMGYN